MHFIIVDRSTLLRPMRFDSNIRYHTLIYAVLKKVLHNPTELYNVLSTMYTRRR